MRLDFLQGEEVNFPSSLNMNRDWHLNFHWYHIFDNHHLTVIDIVMILSFDCICCCQWGGAKMSSQSESFPGVFCPVWILPSFPMIGIGIASLYISTQGDDTKIKREERENTHWNTLDHLIRLFPKINAMESNYSRLNS